MFAVTSSLLSLKSRSWEEFLGWGGYHSLPLSLCLCLSPSLCFTPSYIMSKQERREEEKCGTAASDLWLAWFSLLVTFELHSSMARRWLLLWRQFEHINVKHAAWNLQARCHYTVFTQYVPIKIEDPFASALSREKCYDKASDKQSTIMCCNTTLW